MADSVAEAVARLKDEVQRFLSLVGWAYSPTVWPLVLS